MTDLQQIRERHEIEAAMDENAEYSQWSQPALAARLRQSNRDRAFLLAEVDKLQRKYDALADGVKGLAFKWHEPGSWSDDTWHHGNMATLCECSAALRALLEELNDE